MSKITLGSIVGIAGVAALASIEAGEAISSAKKTFESEMAATILDSKIREVSSAHSQTNTLIADIASNRDKISTLPVEVAQECQNQSNKCQTEISSKISAQCQEVIKGQTPKEFVSQYGDQGLNPKYSTDCYLEVGPKLVACEKAQYQCEIDGLK